MNERNELKPGDMALIIASVDAEEIGRVVEAVELLQPGESAQWVDPVDGLRPGYSEEGVGPAWLVVGDVRTLDGDYGYCLYDPKHLMPLRDDGDGVRELEREKDMEVVV